MNYCHFDDITKLTQKKKKTTTTVEVSHNHVRQEFQMCKGVSVLCVCGKHHV
jgi:hypothetical protein